MLQESHALVAEPVANFRPVRLIGEGGMASVYEALAVDDTRVALKVVRSDLDVDAQTRARFMREARLANAIEHPAAVPIREAGQTSTGQVYLVMELLLGHSFEQLRVARGGTLPAEDVTRTGLEVLDFLTTAHAAGILHRDIKPANLFRTLEGELKVLDLGIGVALGNRDSASIRTELGSILGTPAFMSPEHARGRFDEVDARSDLWSVGATLFTLLTGRPVHEGDTPMEQLGCAMILPARSIIQLLPNLSPHLINAIDGALSYDPEMRWQSARQMREVLQGTEVAREVRLRPVSEPRLGALASARTVASTSQRLEHAAPAPACLPSEVNTFIGRTDVLNQLERLISEARLVTVTGPGGSGKTRLALRVAHQARAAYGERVFFVPLELVAEPSLVAPAMAAVLKLREVPQHSALEQLAEHLALHRTLIVLDNFEHLRGAAPVLSRLLERAPRLHLVVTSRATLRLSGEHVFEVPTLSTPPEQEWNDPARVATFEAVRLFMQRGRAADARFELTEDNAAAVAWIVCRLDGLPLAIELAAARLRLWTPASLVERLSNTLETLTLGPRDLPERQRTLRDTLAWSYALLDPMSQVVLRQLGCFVGEFTIRAAEAIVEVPSGGSVDAAMEELVDFSLVQRRVVSGQPRLRLLETIREFALQQSRAAGEAVAVGSRHLRYYLDFAEELEPTLTREGQRQALQELDLERANLGGALDYCLWNREFETGLRLVSATWRYWHGIGRSNEGRSWLDRLLAMQAPAKVCRPRR